MPRFIDNDEPCFSIGSAARIVGLHAQTLRYYERAGLLQPSRSKGHIRLYSRADIARLEHIRSLTDDLGLNLAGVEVIMRMRMHMAEMEQRIQELMSQLESIGAAEPTSDPADGRRRKR